MADLAALLEKEASAEIEAIHSEARDRASEIVARAEEEAEQLVARRVRAAEQQHAATLVRARSAAQLEASSMRLRAQQRAIESVFDEAREKIDALVADAKSYAPVLKSLMQEAVDGLGASGRTRVRVHPDEVAVAEKVAKDLGVDAEVVADERVRGGARVQAAGGGVAVENTLYGRLDALRDELASEVSRILHQEAS